MRWSIKKRILLIIGLIVLSQLSFSLLYFRILKEQLFNQWYENRTTVLKALSDKLLSVIATTSSTIASKAIKYEKLGLELEQVLWRLTGDVEYLHACAYYDNQGKLMFWTSRSKGLSFPNNISGVDKEGEVVRLHRDDYGTLYADIKTTRLRENVNLGFIVCKLSLTEIVDSLLPFYGIKNVGILEAGVEGLPKDRGWHIAVQPIKELNLQLIIKEPYDKVYGIANTFIKASLLAGLPLSIGLFLISFLVVKRIFKPLEELKRSVLEWHKDKNISVEGQGEVQILAETFRSLLEDIQREKNVYMDMFNHIGDGLLLVNRKTGRVHMVNRRFLELFNVSEDDILGLNIKVLNPDITHDTPSFVPEIYIKLKDRIRTVVLQSIPLKIEDEEYLLFHFKDITDRRELELLLERNSKLAIAGEIACSLAHQLNNPLASIMVYAEYLRNIASDRELEKMADVIIKQAGRAKETVKKLLDMSKSYDGSPKVIDPVEFTKELIELLSHKARCKNITMELFSDIANVRIVAYPWKIEQIIINLIDNAIEASPEGSKVSVYVGSQNGHITWRVRDRGPGVRSDKVFMPFYTTKQDGYGLGLSLAKRLTDELGGRLEYRNLEEGCEFIFMLGVEVNR